MLNDRELFKYDVLEESGLVPKVEGFCGPMHADEMVKQHVSRKNITSNHIFVQAEADTLPGVL